MKYTRTKVGHRIVHVPDGELMRVLKSRLESFKWAYSVRTEISTFGRRMGLAELLPRHVCDRFFVVVDFVYAFHQITQQMVKGCIRYDNPINLKGCFVRMGGREVVPIGFPTSNWLFELFMSRIIDPKLVWWQENHNGHITRNGDNILATWRKNSLEAFEDLRAIFHGFETRATPSKPRKWNGTVRFCGLALERHKRPSISNRKRRRILVQAEKRSPESLRSALRFLDGIDRIK